MRAAITTDAANRILVHGKPVSAEQLMTLRETAASTLRSPARNLIHEQVRFMAIDRGFFQSDDPKAQVFYKAALWYAEQENDLLTQLAADSYTQPSQLES